jgi:hypothetical protein
VNPYIIYVHRNSVTRIPFYIGTATASSANPWNVKNRSANWRLAASNGRTVEILETRYANKAQATTALQTMAESYWGIGVPLVNDQAIKRTSEHKAAISKAQTGKTLSPDTREKISKAQTGKTLSPETVAKRSKAREQHKNKRLIYVKNRNGRILHTVNGDTLRYADLSGLNLVDADLRGFDLTGAVLCNTDLRGADLSEVVIRDANLTGADLRNANLRHTDFDGGNMTDADLTGADLYETILEFVVLHGTKGL